MKQVVKEKLKAHFVHRPNEGVQKYISSCVEIMWLMVVQDPPLALSISSSSRFDTQVFREYTKRGPDVDYVVWPALLLHEGGPLLCKGVAQGCNHSRRHR